MAPQLSKRALLDEPPCWFSQLEHTIRHILGYLQQLFHVVYLDFVYVKLGSQSLYKLEGILKWFIIFMLFGSIFNKVLGIVITLSTYVHKKPGFTSGVPEEEVGNVECVAQA